MHTVRSSGARTLLPSVSAEALAARRGDRAPGQSFVEFALVVPLLLGLLGSVTDFARVYQGWITLQGATRAAAEVAATKAQTSTAAAAAASERVCTEMSGIAGFSGSASTCSNPDVTIVSYTRSTTAAGASTKYPVTTVTVRSQFDFHTLFAYPLLTDAGNWTLEAEATYSVVQNR